VRVLILEANHKAAAFLKRLLAEEGYRADVCASGGDALARGRFSRYNLILLDGNLPDLDGLSFCRGLRRQGEIIPILMLTARGELQDRVLALEAGIDAYILKPFEVPELLARVHSLLRRAAGFPRLRPGELEFDLGHRTVMLYGQALDLTLREYAVLLHLMYRLNQPVPSSELLIHVWGVDSDKRTNSIPVLISSLRRKFGTYAWMLVTVRGSSYCLRSEPEG
jgi:DNA-binding response OmpR family regulator